VLGFLSAATVCDRFGLGDLTRFNPVLGFLSAATSSSSSSAVSRTLFQSRAGFSLRRDRISEIEDAGAVVSIPCWVFSPPRPSIPTSLRSKRQFQSRAGFSLRRDIDGGLLDRLADLFQSRAGFSLRRDIATDSAAREVIKCFNPVLGFLSAATTASPGTTTPTSLFQSRAGFSLRRDTSLHPPRNRRPRVSIPCWVFSPPRQLERHTSTKWA